MSEYTCRICGCTHRYTSQGFEQFNAIECITALAERISKLEGEKNDTERLRRSTR